MLPDFSPLFSLGIFCCRFSIWNEIALFDAP
jgi:hypothetical protein